jgi:nitrogenase-stabilizing/protective protein
MTDSTLEALGRLSAAEEFFTYLGVPYDSPVVHVNRLHILKRFNQYLRAAKPPVAELDPATQLQACRDLLGRAYGDFVTSTPAREKVFKVFQDADGASVGIDGLRSSLPSRNVRPT